MAGGSDVLNNREWALLFWLTVVVVWALSRRDVRSSLLQMIRSLRSSKIALPLLALVAYVGVLCASAARINLWQPSLLKDTTIWLVGPGLSLFFSMTEAAQPGFFKQIASRTFKATVIVELFVNLVVFSLIAEIALQFVLGVLVAMSVLAGTDPKFLLVKRLVDSVLSLVGVAIVLYVAYAVTTEWRQLDARHEFLALLLPLWLTISALPFVFVLALFATYEQIFLRMDFSTSTQRAPWHAKLAVLATINVRLRHLTDFTYPWIRDVAQSGSFWDACCAMRPFFTREQVRG